MNQNFIMIFGNKKIKFLLLVFIIFVSIYYYNYNFKVPVYSKNLIQKLNSKDYKYIAHAGGGIEGKIYTNSLEAITNSINLGYKLIEIDLRETNDDVFVGVQSWAKFKKDTNFTDNNPDINSAISYKDFKNLKIFNKYKPVDTNIINVYWLVFIKNL